MRVLVLLIATIFLSLTGTAFTQDDLKIDRMAADTMQSFTPDNVMLSGAMSPYCPKALKVYSWLATRVRPAFLSLGLNSHPIIQSRRIHIHLPKWSQFLAVS
jgi:zona occludens toxin (predicted ATPase)